METFLNGKTVKGKVIGNMEVSQSLYDSSDGSLIDFECEIYPVIETASGKRYTIIEGEAIEFCEVNEKTETMSFRAEFHAA